MHTIFSLWQSDKKTDNWKKTQLSLVFNSSKVYIINLILFKHSKWRNDGRSRHYWSASGTVLLNSLFTRMCYRSGFTSTYSIEGDWRRTWLKVSSVSLQNKRLDREFDLFRGGKYYPFEIHQNRYRLCAIPRCFTSLYNPIVSNEWGNWRKWQGELKRDQTIKWSRTLLELQCQEKSERMIK